MQCSKKVRGEDNMSRVRYNYGFSIDIKRVATVECEFEQSFTTQNRKTFFHKVKQVFQNTNVAPQLFRIGYAHEWTTDKSGNIVDQAATVSSTGYPQLDTNNDGIIRITCDANQNGKNAVSQMFLHLKNL